MNLPTNPFVPPKLRWTVVDQQPKVGASCSQPFCGLPAKYVLTRPGLKQRRNACARCAKLKVEGSLR
jgi:hypothetical protein